MRIAIVCPYSLARPGGVQGQVVALARELNLGGHVAVVLAPFHAAPALRAQLCDRASGEVLSIGGSLPVPSNGSVAPVALDPAAVFRALRMVREGEFDVVHLHEPLAPFAGYGVLLASDNPKVGTFHRSGAALAYRALGLAVRSLASRIDTRCAVSPEAASTAETVLGGSYEIVGNGVDVARFETAPPWPTTGPTVLFVGRHERRKGLQTLLEAWSTAIEGDARGVLWIAGEGPQTKMLRTRYGNARGVEWLGRIPDEEVASRLRGAHVLCAPSISGESFGMILVEAMAARTAVVASDIPGYAYVAGSHAVLVEPADPLALGRALSRAICEAEEGTGICSAQWLDLARDHVRKWSMEQLASRYVSVYRRLLS